MGIEAQITHIEEMLEQVLSILQSKSESEKIKDLIDQAVTKKPEKEFYSVAETAEIVGRSAFQVREWCKTGRIEAKKRATGYGPHKEWAIPADEIKAYQNLGLRPVDKNKPNG